eukprot:391455_1
MFLLQYCLAISLITSITFGGYPISNPHSTTLEDKTTPYNLIDTDPSCFHQEICPMFPPGGELSSFPNSEEKFQQLLGNLHRMFPNQSLGTPLGHWKNGANTIGGETTFCTTPSPCRYCGHAAQAPLYWYSDANQAARFKQWDYKHCDKAWYTSAPENTDEKHGTCKWGLNPVSTWGSGSYSITGRDRCALFGINPNPLSITTDPTPFDSRCEFGYRASKFCHDDKDRCWFETEGICGGNSCLWDPHCEPIFATKYDYV